MELNILISKSGESPCTAYADAVTRAGGLPHLAYCPPPDTGYDGLLLCGGGDVAPEYYGQENCGSTEIDPLRDAAELALVRAYLAAEKPILAVCRGHQLVNIALGGTLIQDLSQPLRLFHTRAPGAEEDRVHAVRTGEGSLLRRLYGDVFPVNSYHHQVVDALGQDLKVTARSEAGMIEAMEHKTLPLLCVQFHPERMTAERAHLGMADGGAIFDWFLGQCGGQKNAE